MELEQYEGLLWERSQEMHRVTSQPNEFFFKAWQLGQIDKHLWNVQDYAGEEDGWKKL